MVNLVSGDFFPRRIWYERKKSACIYYERKKVGTDGCGMSRKSRAHESSSRAPKRWSCRQASPHAFRPARIGSQRVFDYYSAFLSFMLWGEVLPQNRLSTKTRAWGPSERSSQRSGNLAAITEPSCASS